MLISESHDHETIMDKRTTYQTSTENTCSLPVALKVQLCHNNTFHFTQRQRASYMVCEI